MKKQGYSFSFQHLKMLNRGFLCIFMLFFLFAFLLGVTVLPPSSVNAQTVPGEEWGQQDPPPSPATDGGSDDDNYSIVHIPDENLEKAIREHLNIPSGDITKENMLWLIELVADGYETDGHAGPIKHSNGIKDLTGLEYAKNLESLSMEYNDIVDIAPLKGLSNLGSLFLDWNMIKNIETLSSLTSLEVLTLSLNGISDISALSNLTNLEELFVGGNNIYDISPLSNLRNLKRLNIVGNKIYDISPIANLTNLEHFLAADNSIVNIEPLKNIKTFKSVSIGWNYIDINPGSTSKKIIDDLISSGVDVRYSPQRVSAPPSTADLSALTISEGSLNPAFSPSTTAYTVAVSDSINSVNITANLSDSSASMTINGAATSSGATRNVSLNAAGTSTVINIVVTARDGVTQKTYRVTVNRAAPVSNNANLSSLSVSVGSLSPTFSQTTTSYNVTVPHTTNSLNVTATLSDSKASMKINGATISSGTSRSISLNAPGSATVINVVVTAEDGSTQKAYMVTVSREPKTDTNIDLKALTIKPEGLTPAFSPDKLSYTVDVAHHINTVNITAVLAGSNATMEINGKIEASGKEKRIDLNDAGTATVVDIIVTYSDGGFFTFRKKYSVTINRAAIPRTNADLTALTVNPGSLTPPFSKNRLVYEMDVQAEISTIDVTATAYDPRARIFINGNRTANGESRTVVLNDKGSTTDILVHVYSAIGVPKIYRITVNRLPTNSLILKAPFHGKNIDGNFYSISCGHKQGGHNAYIRNEDGKAIIVEDPNRSHWCNTYALDFGSMPVDSDVISVADGKVHKVFDDANRSMGRELRVLHEAPDGKEYLACYGHLDSIRVKEGQEVKTGQVIALSGQSGKPSWGGTYDPHLHFLLSTETRPGHSVPIEFMWLKRLEPENVADENFRRYDSTKGDFDGREAMGKYESNNIRLGELSATANSPVSIRIYDSSNRVTGVFDGEIKTEIPGSTYLPEHKKISIIPAVDEYRIELIGDAEGTYRVEFFNVSEKGTMLFEFRDMPTNKGEAHEYNIDWSSLAEGNEGVAIVIDGETTRTGLPNEPEKPSPEDLSKLKAGEIVNLAWSIDSKKTSEQELTYEVYFGKDTYVDLEKVATIGPFSSNQKSFSYDLNKDLEDETFYFWRVVAINQHGLALEGPLWAFHTHELLMLGDITGNGKVYVEDVVLAMKYALELEKLTDKQIEAADVNGDGVVNVLDVVLIMRYALKIIDEF